VGSLIIGYGSMGHGSNGLMVLKRENFYKAFLPHDARSAKRGIAIVGRPSVGLSIARLSVSNIDIPRRGRTGWTSSKLIIRKLA